MKNNLASMLQEAKNKGVRQGLFLMSQICLIALDNQVRMWNIEVDDEFFRDVERDMDSILNETVASVPCGDHKEMAERVDYYVNEIRERRKMDDLEGAHDGNNV